MINDNHVCNIAEKMEEILANVEGISKVSIESADLSNIPEDYEVFIDFLPDRNEPILGSSDFDGFNDVGFSNTKTPDVDQIYRSMLIEITKRGRNKIGVMNVAARCYAALINNNELRDMVDFMKYDGSIPYDGNPKNIPYVSVALVFVLKYSTNSGSPDQRIKSK